MTRTKQPKRMGLAGDALAGMGSAAMLLTSRIFCAPLVLTFVSLETFGLWSLCFVILAYVAMSGFGIHSAYIKLSAEWFAQNRPERINQLLQTGMMLMALVGLIALSLLAWLNPVLPTWFAVPKSMHADARLLFMGTAVFLVSDLCFGAFRSVLEGAGYIAKVKLIQAVTALIELPVMTWLLVRGMGVHALMLAYGFRVWLEIIWCARCLHQVTPLRMARTNFSADVLRRLLGFGGKVQISGLLAMVGSSLDRFIIGTFLGPAAVGLFELGRKFPFAAKAVSSAAFGPFLPEASRLSQQSNGQNTPASLFLKGTRWTLMINAFLFTFLAVAAAPLIQLWVGETYAEAARVTSLLALAYGIQQTTGPACLIFRGLNQTRREWTYNGLLLILTLLCVPMGIAHGGVQGAATALVLTSAFSALVLLIQGCRYFRISFEDCCRQLLIPCSAPIIPAVLAAWLLSLFGDTPMHQFIGLIAAGALFTLMTAAVFLIWVINPEERRFLNQSCQKLTGRWSTC